MCVLVDGVRNVVGDARVREDCEEDIEDDECVENEGDGDDESDDADDDEEESDGDGDDDDNDDDDDGTNLNDSCHAFTAQERSNPGGVTINCEVDERGQGYAKTASSHPSQPPPGW